MVTVSTKMQTVWLIPLKTLQGMMKGKTGMSKQYPGSQGCMGVCCVFFCRYIATSTTEIQMRILFKISKQSSDLKRMFFDYCHFTSLVTKCIRISL